MNSRPHSALEISFLEAATFWKILMINCCLCWVSLNAVTVGQAPSSPDELQFLRVAADHQDPRAQGILAFLMGVGSTSQEELTRAAKFASGSVGADNVFGIFALESINRLMEPTRATEAEGKLARLIIRLEPLAIQGDRWASSFLAEIFRGGWGVPRDLAKAAVFLQSPQNPGLNLNLRSRFDFPAAPAFQIVVLGDSMSLDGFGKRLDERLRTDPRVEKLFTYMACGTGPLSWIREGRFTNVTTHCGFWTIESKVGSVVPSEFQDTYETTGGELRCSASEASLSS